MRERQRLACVPDRRSRSQRAKLCFVCYIAAGATPPQRRPTPPDAGGPGALTAGRSPA